MLLTGDGRIVRQQRPRLWSMMSMAAVMVVVSACVAERRRRRPCGRGFTRLRHSLRSRLFRPEAVLPTLDPLVDFGRPAPRASRQFERVRQDPQQSLQVLLCGLRAPWERYDEATGACAGRAVNQACDGSREGGKWGDGEGRREHGRHEARSRSVDQRADYL